MEQETLIPPATTPGEINTHLGYLRRDIKILTDSTKEQLQTITKQIQNLDDHYTTETEFRPFADQVKQNSRDIKVIVEWKDTLNGKILGFGVAISVVTSLLTIGLTYWIHR